MWKDLVWKQEITLKRYLVKGLSLKHAFGGCGHGFDGCDGLGGLGRFGGFDGFSRFGGFGGLGFLSFIYSATKGFISSCKLSSELYLAEGWTTNK